MKVERQPSNKSPQLLTQQQSSNTMSKTKTKIVTSARDPDHTTKPSTANPNRKKRTEIAIETKRPSTHQQSQPLFLKTTNRIGKENTKVTLAGSQTNIFNKTKQKVPPLALKDLVAQKKVVKTVTSPSNTSGRTEKIPAGLPRPHQLSSRQKMSPCPRSPMTQQTKYPALKKPQLHEPIDTKTSEVDTDQQTEHAQFVSKKNPHEIVRQMQKKERLFMFACYDHMADPSIFRQILQKLPTQRTFPQEMCQLVIKDYELCFGKDPHEQDERLHSNNAHEYLNPDESIVPDEAPEVKTFVRKAKDKFLFVQAYLLPLDQLIELVSYLTDVTQNDLKIPERFSFRQPLRLMTPKGSFFNCLAKLSPFESLDVLCLTRDDIQSSMQQKCTSGVIPPRCLVQTLFKTYSNVFKVNQTEHTLLYYLFSLQQISKHYKMLDMVQVVASDLLKQAHQLKQEEPTLMDQNNQTIQNTVQNRQDYERIDSPVPSYLNKQSPVRAPFKISLLEMPLDPGSTEKKGHEREQNTQDVKCNEGQHPLLWNAKSQRKSQQNLQNSYLVSNQKSQASLNLNVQSREQVQEVLSMASEKKFGLGGNIISGLMKSGQFGNGFDSTSRNSFNHSGQNTIQSNLSAFGNCPFNASNLSLSVYGDKSIIGGQGAYGRGVYAMMNNFNNQSPKRPPMASPTESPYGRPSLEATLSQKKQQNLIRRVNNNY